MGTMITLGVGKLEINWGKNDFYENFRDLFQPNDWKNIKYYYADNVVEIKKGYSRKLALVKPRLDLLGYTLENIKTIYESTYTEYCDVMGEYADPVLTFRNTSMFFRRLTCPRLTH